MGKIPPFCYSAPRTIMVPVPGKGSSVPRIAAALAALGLALGTSAAGAAEPPVRVTRGDAVIELPPEALGLGIDHADTGAVAQVRWDRPRLLQACADLADSLSLEPPFEGDIDLDAGAVEPVYPTAGEAIDCPALAASIEDALSRGGAVTVPAPIVPLEPAVTPADVDALTAELRDLLSEPLTLDITFTGEPAGALHLSPDDLRDALVITAKGSPAHLDVTLRPAALKHLLDPVLAPLGEPAEDARFEIDARGDVTVIPSREGVRVTGADLLASAKEAAKKPEKKAAVAAEKAEPSLTTKKAEALQIKGLVASFTTKYPCCQARVTNIHRIAALLDGAIVDAKDRFSVNRHVGKRTAKRGFVLAPSIGEGELVETIGGGVSQVTTTLYNAVFDAGYAVVSRKPHFFYFSRYPLGIEATLSHPRPDFVFRNDSETGILIRASFTNESVTIKLYGDNGGRKVKRIVGKPFDYTDPRIDYEPDESLPMDKPKVKDSGTQGFSVTAGRDIVFADGTKKHEERKVIYHGKPRVIAAHPCAIPKGEKGHRKKGCPKVEDGAAMASAGNGGDGKSAGDDVKGAASAPKKEDTAKKDAAGKDAAPVKGVDDTDEPAKKTDVTKQDEPAKKDEPTKKDEPAKKTDVAKQDEPAKKADVAKKDEPAKKADVAKKDEPVKKADSSKKAEPSKKDGDIKKGSGAKTAKKDAGPKKGDSTKKGDAPAKKKRGKASARPT